MPSNGKNTGSDVSVDIITPYGAIQIDPDFIMDFHPQPVTVNQRSKGLSGKTRNQVIPDGHRGSFTVHRYDATLDNWWAQYEADYHAGVLQSNSTITETIRNADGSVSQFRYIDVTLDIEDFGRREADQPIAMRVNFNASRRERVV